VLISVAHALALSRRERREGVSGRGLTGGGAYGRETLHDFSIEYVKVLAEVFGWRVREAKGSRRGPDLIIEDVADGEVVAVMFVESEVGHDKQSARKYFEQVAKRLRPRVDEYRGRGLNPLFSLVVITNAPRKLASYVRAHGREISEKIGFDLTEGFTLFIVPVLFAKEIIPAIFVRATGATARFAST
jgi:hypothetical protein